jgi:hypothetical protein
MKKRKGGRKPMEPTAEQRKMVSDMVAFGIPALNICGVLGISHPTLEKHFRDEIDNSKARANTKVAGMLFKAAVEKDDRTAQIFWLKTQAGWKEPRDEQDGQKVFILNLPPMELRENYVRMLTEGMNGGNGTGRVA